MPENVTLLTINLALNHLSSEGARKMVERLKHGSQLCNVGMNGNIRVNAHDREELELLTKDNKRWCFSSVVPEEESEGEETEEEEEEEAEEEDDEEWPELGDEEGQEDNERVDSDDEAPLTPRARGEDRVQARTFKKASKGKGASIDDEGQVGEGGEPAPAAAKEEEVPAPSKDA